MTTLRTFALALLVAAAAGCDDAKDPVAPLVVTQITLSNGGCATLRVDGECQLVARAIAADGTEVPNANLQWISENVTIATVNFEGRVSGLRVGTATIRVQTPNEAVSRSTTITVSPAPTPPI